MVDPDVNLPSASGGMTCSRTVRRGRPWPCRNSDGLKRGQQILDSITASKARIHVLQCCTTKRRGYRAFARHDDLTPAMPNLEQLFIRGS